jgi:hypothetical protein
VVWPRQLFSNKKHLSKLTASKFCALIKGIRLCAFTRKAWSPSNISGVVEDQVGKEFLAHTWFLQEVETYKTLK